MVRHIIKNLQEVQERSPWTQDKQSTMASPEHLAYVQLTPCVQQESVPVSSQAIPILELV